MNDAVTKAHIARVQELMGEAAAEIVRRGVDHDQSKFTEEEAGPLRKLQEIIDREGNVPYGTEEYKKRTALLGPMLRHHYANNSHHPEHYENGVLGMDLFDLMEMFFDWKAASERGGETTMNLSYSMDKYSFPHMLRMIFRNTAERRGYDWK